MRKRYLFAMACVCVLMGCGEKPVNTSELEFTFDGITLNGELYTGKTIGYHKNGKLASKGVFKDGLPDGVLEDYYENGKLKRKGTPLDFFCTEWDGAYEEYDENGKLVKKGTYKDGEFVSK